MLRITVLALLLAATAPAQMSGTYTIDPNGSGSRNFKDFANATYQLFSQGVSARVMIEVAPGNYDKNWNVAPIKGVSATNTVTFKSKTALGAKLAGQLTLADYTLSFPVAWVVLDGFEFVSTNTSRAIYAIGTSNNIEIKNCKFSSTWVQANAANDNQIDGWSIHHNTFDVGASTSAISIVRCGAFDIYNNDFRCNRSGHVIDKAGRHVGSGRRSRIYNNLISGVVNGGRSGIRVAEYTDVDHNTVVLDDVNNSTGSHCIYVVGLLGRHNEFRNNILVNFSKGPAMYVRGDLKSFEWFSNANICYTPRSTVGSILHVNNSNSATPYTSLTSWQQASGEDADSMFTDPKLVGGSSSPGKLKLDQGSPAIGAAKNTRSWITTDFAGNSRPSPASIGAFEGQGVSTFVAFGKGCAGTFNNVPKIGYTGDLKLGSTDFAVTLSNALGGARAIFALGVSNTKIGSVSLPFPFGGGCNLLTSSDVLLQLVTSGSGPGNGTASVKFRIPDKQGLKGAKLHFQWGVVDPAAKGIGLAFSDGATVTL